MKIEWKNPPNYGENFLCFDNEFVMNEAFFGYINQSLIQHRFVVCYTGKIREETFTTEGPFITYWDKQINITIKEIQENAE